MINDLKLIKNKYGENMMRFCRECFPTLLETPGMLFTLLSNRFAYNKFLYDDIIEQGAEQEFKNYIYSLVCVEKPKITINKSPKELLNEAGYILYECKTEEDIQKFKKYYAKDEELCTFNGGRLCNYYVFFAVKKNADEIKRKNFNNPERQDEYGTSVISIQFSKGEKNTVSIKNRYNHRVKNPDATFNNNLDNIIEGLTGSFIKEYKLNINQKNNGDFELDNYVLANDEKYYKYNYEINNIYYCIDNIIIDNIDDFGVIYKYKQKEKYLIFDYFILDLENKTIKLYDNYIKDSFVDNLNQINKIEIKNEKETGNKNIYLYLENGKKAIIEINRLNQMISYKNNSIYKIENNFLRNNKTIKKIQLPNVIDIGGNFLRNNEENIDLYFPKVMRAGENFLLWNKAIESVELPMLEEVGKDFLYSSRNLFQLKLPNLKIAGSGFLYGNLSLNELNLPNLIVAGNDFLHENEKLFKLKLPNLIKVYCDFMFYNSWLQEINLPKLESVGANFFAKNENNVKLFLPRLKKIDGFSFLRNATVEILDLPNLEEVGNDFLYCDTSLKLIHLPKLKRIGEGFLYNNLLYNRNMKYKIIKIINHCKKEEQKVLKLEKKKNGN